MFTHRIVGKIKIRDSSEYLDLKTMPCGIFCGALVLEFD
jgi:hypothetical protein